MIYFIQGGRFVKIGCSDHPRRRMKTLQTAYPTKLKLLATMPGDFQTEKSLHMVFKHKKKVGEWFRYDGDLKWCIVAINDAGNPFKVNDVRSFQKAGQHLRIRQKANRQSSGKVKNKINRIKNILSR